MSLANIALYVAILGFVVFRRIQGRPLVSVRQLLLLPVIVTVLGFEDMTHRSLGAVDVTFAVIGCVLSFGLGALRGTTNLITVRDGAPWVKWGTRSVVIFAVNIAAKIALDVGCVIAGGTASGASSSLVLSGGLMLLGEAAVVLLRVSNGAYPHLSGSRIGDDRRVGTRGW